MLHVQEGYLVPGGDLANISQNRRNQLWYRSCILRGIDGGGASFTSLSSRGTTMALML